MVLMRKTFLMSIVLFCAVFTTVAEPDPNFHIYLTFGQSNMAGGCKPGNENDCDTSSESAQRVKVLAFRDCNRQSTACLDYTLRRTANQWYTAFPPYNNCNEGIGPADYFGKTMIDSVRDDITIGIIPCSFSGQRIELFEKGNTQYSAPTWSHPTVGTGVYDFMVEKCRIAQQAGVLKGILIHQGESNAGDGDRWVDKVVGIYNDLKADLNIDHDIPFIAGELRYGGCCDGLNPYVNKLPDRIPNCVVASAQGLQPRNPDDQWRAHFDTPSMREFGRRYAKAILSVSDEQYIPRAGSVNTGLRISVQTSGRGTVTKTPSLSSYPKDTTVTLTATPRSGWGFSGWSGDINSEENPLTITVDTNISLTADFIRTGIDTTQLVTNGEFSLGSESWTLNNWGGEGSGSVVSGEYRISISSVGSNAYEIQLVQPGINLVEGITYKLSFEAYSPRERTMEVTIGQHESPWDKYIDEPLLASLSDTKQSFEIVFEMTDPTDENTRIEFNAGDKMGDVFIDNVSLKEASATPVRTVTRKKFDGLRITSSGITFGNGWSGDVAVNMYSLAGKLVHRDVFTPAQRDKIFRFNRIHIAEGLYIAKVCSDNITLHTELVHMR